MYGLYELIKSELGKKAFLVKSFQTKAQAEQHQKSGYIIEKC